MKTIDSTMMENFQRLCRWLEEEGDSELYTLSEVHSKMEELSKGSECYSTKSVKLKLAEHFGNTSIFSKVLGSAKPRLLQWHDLF